LDLTFTGDACVYEGPEWIKPGSISLNFVNEGDMQVAFNSIRHLDNKTHEDMVESLGGDTGPLFGHAPEWTEELGTFEWIKPGKVFNWEGDLEPGLYTIAVQRMSGAVWYCVGLTVVE
jgi:hypothetical protein